MTTTLNTDTNTITTPVNTYPIVKKSPSVKDTMYAFRRLEIGWINSGMVDNNKRGIFARYLMAGRPWSSDKSLTMEHLLTKGEPQDEKATEVAFMPYCIEDTNYMAQELIDSDSVETIS